MSDPERLLLPAEVARKAHTTVSTLSKWRSERRPGRKRVPLKFVKFGGKVLYRAADVDAFIASRTHVPGEKPKRKRGA